MANSHRSYQIIPEQYAKPYKVRRFAGQWHKCAICSGLPMKATYNRHNMRKFDGSRFNSKFYGGKHLYHYRKF